MSRNKITIKHEEASPGQQEAIRKYFERLTSPDTPRELARAWLSSLSLEELEQERAWLDGLIQQKKEAENG